MTLDYSNFYHPAGCGYPATPANGSIIRFESAAVGSQIQYSCDPEFLPMELTNSTCASDMNWSPNPADFTCREPGKGAMDDTHIYSAVHYLKFALPFQSTVLALLYLP